MKLTNSPIQRKLTKIVLLTSTAVLMLTCFTFFAYDFFAFRQADKNSLTTLGKIIADNSTAALAFQNHDDAYEMLNTLKAEKHIVSAGLYDSKGHLFAIYPIFLKPGDLPDAPGKDGYTYSNSSLQGYQPVVQEGRRLGTLYLKSNMLAMYDRFQLYGLLMLFVIASSSALAFFLSRHLQKTISRPILLLADAAGIISNKHDYTVRAEKIADDELGLLTDAFNQMLAEIEAQNAEITAFSQDLEKKVIERTIELEQVNAGLKLQNEFVETILNSSVHHIAVVDNDMRFTAMNSMLENFYGFKNNEAIGKSFIEIFPESKNAKIYNDIKATLGGEYIYNPVLKSLRLDTYFENHLVPLKHDNKIYGALILSHDITNIVEANEKLIKVNAKLEKSNNDLEQYAYVASHDLQEPLRKIQTFSDYIQRNLNDREALEKYLSKIIFSAARMSDLIKAILNYSRLANSNDHFEEVNLNKIIDNIIIDLELVINEKEAVINAGELPVISGISLQLNQLFLNLVSNSLKFSDKPPVINISGKIVAGNEAEECKNLKPETRYAEIVCSDNGLGFEQQYANKIFNVFQRLHNKSEYQGTGIGLALCKKIVDNHNGCISAKGELRKGATFTIYLPVVEQ